MRAIDNAGKGGIIPLATIYIRGTRLAGLPVEYNSSFPDGRTPCGVNRQGFHCPLM